MTPNDAIKLTIDMANEILTTYLSDLGDADLMVRSVPGANHIAWQLGHLVSSEQSMLTGVGFAMPDLPDGFAASYTKETSTSDDATKFHKKDEYLKAKSELNELDLTRVWIEEAKKVIHEYKTGKE